MSSAPTADLSFNKKGKLALPSALSVGCIVSNFIGILLAKAIRAQFARSVSSMLNSMGSLLPVSTAI